MNGNLPSGADFNFNSNGYPCAIGVDTFNLDSGGTSYEFRLVKMKSKASSPSPSISEWEFVHNLFLEGREDEDVKDIMAEFLAGANPKLKTATGGEVPPVPNSFLDQAKHLCRYGLAFNASTGEVYIK